MRPINQRTSLLPSSITLAHHTSPIILHKFWRQHRRATTTKTHTNPFAMSFTKLSPELQEIILGKALIHPHPINLAHPQPSTGQTEVMFGPTTPQTAVADFNNLRITFRAAYSACSRFFFAKNEFVVHTLDHLKHIDGTLSDRDLDLITSLCCMRDVWIPTQLRFFTNRPTIEEFFKTLAHFPKISVISFIQPRQFNNPPAYVTWNPRSLNVLFETFLLELADRLPQSAFIMLLRPESTGVDCSYLFGPHGTFHHWLDAEVLEADQEVEDSLYAWLSFSRKHRIEAKKMLLRMCLPPGWKEDGIFD